MLGSDYGNFSAVYRLGKTLSTTLRRAPADDGRPMTPAAPRPLRKSIVLVGLMGAGKSSVGRRLAKRFEVRFIDADDEIAKAAGCSIEDIFELYGEEAFRNGEHRVIVRLLDVGPRVLATGGGAFMDPRIRAKIGESGISVWLRADLAVLVRRTDRRGGRPLLKGGDPRATLARLIDERYPVYAEADIIVDTGDEPAETTVERVVEAIEALAEPGDGGEARR